MSVSLAVDLYPLALHVSLCDAAGRPGGRERLVLTSHHVHVRDMLLEALDSSSLRGLSRGLSLNAVSSMQEEVSIVLCPCDTWHGTLQPSFANNHVWFAGRCQ